MKTINEKSNELMALIMPHRATNVMQRVQAWSTARTGKKISEFLANGAGEEVKNKFLDDLIVIVKTSDWDQLPVAPGGQAAVPAKAIVSVTKPKVIVPERTPVLKALVEASESLAPTELDQRLAAAHAVDAETRPANEDDVNAAVTALRMALRPKPAAPSLTEEQVRLIARREIASVLRTIADVIDGQTK